MRARSALTPLLLLGLLGLPAGCGPERIGLDDDAGPGGGGGGGGADDDGGEAQPCVPGDTQCTNCVDDDGDALVDGSDPHCSGPLDDDEESFATGVPGDNRDPKKQDCFFDGNSGGCQVHTCCLLPEPCDEATYGNFDAERDCDLSQGCIDECAPITPPGCDCFGCCTVCAPDTGECHDILINQGVSPDCSVDDLASDDCVKCEKSEACHGGGCDPDACILCPGQTEDDLPPGCEASECPGGGATCATSADCDTGDYCSTGCCIDSID